MMPFPPSTSSCSVGYCFLLGQAACMPLQVNQVVLHVCA